MPPSDVKNKPKITRHFRKVSYIRKQMEEFRNSENIETIWGGPKKKKKIVIGMTKKWNS